MRLLIKPHNPSRVSLSWGDISGPHRTAARRRLLFWLNPAMPSGNLGPLYLRSQESPMGLLDRFLGPPSKDQFARLVMEGLRQAGEQRKLIYDAQQFCLRLDGQGGQVSNLVNLYGEFCSAPRDRRALVVR